MPFVVIYDANALYGNAQRDLLIRIAQSGLVQAKLTGPVQRLSGPVIHGPGHRVATRGLQARVRLGLELLELVPDLGLGPPGDLPPDARTVRPPAE